MFQILGIDHVVFRVRDLEAMVRFWGRVLGCPVQHRQPALGLVHLRAGRAQVDLVQMPEGESRAASGEGNVAHLCLRLEPWDLAALEAHFADLGIPVRWDAANFGAEGVGPSLYLQDPEGNLLELKGPAAASDIPKS